MFAGGGGRTAEGGTRGGERGGGGFAVGFDESLMFELGEEGEVWGRGCWVLKLRLGAGSFDRCPSGHSVAVDAFDHHFRHGLADGKLRGGNKVHARDSACGCTT